MVRNYRGSTVFKNCFTLKEKVRTICESKDLRLKAKPKEMVIWPRGLGRGLEVSISALNCILN